MPSTFSVFTSSPVWSWATLRTAIPPSSSSVAGTFTSSNSGEALGYLSYTHRFYQDAYNLGGVTYGTINDSDGGVTYENPSAPLASSNESTTFTYQFNVVSGSTKTVTTNIYAYATISSVATVSVLSTSSTSIGTTTSGTTCLTGLTCSSFSEFTGIQATTTLQYSSKSFSTTGTAAYNFTVDNAQYSDNVFLFLIWDTIIECPPGKTGFFITATAPCLDKLENVGQSFTRTTLSDNRSFFTATGSWFTDSAGVGPPLITVPATTFLESRMPTTSINSSTLTITKIPSSAANFNEFSNSSTQSVTQGYVFTTYSNLTYTSNSQIYNDLWSVSKGVADTFWTTSSGVVLSTNGLQISQVSSLVTVSRSVIEAYSAAPVGFKNCSISQTVLIPQNTNPISFSYLGSPYPSVQQTSFVGQNVLKFRALPGEVAGSISAPAFAFSASLPTWFPSSVIPPVSYAGLDNSFNDNQIFSRIVPISYPSSTSFYTFSSSTNTYSVFTQFSGNTVMATISSTRTSLSVSSTNSFTITVSSSSTGSFSISRLTSMATIYTSASTKNQLLNNSVFFNPGIIRSTYYLSSSSLYSGVQINAHPTSSFYYNNAFETIGGISVGQINGGFYQRTTPQAVIVSNSVIIPSYIS